MLPAPALAQQPCARGMRVDGVVTDPSGAVIPGARVQAAGGATTITDATGHYAFACVRGTSSTITVTAGGFAAATGHARASAGGAAHVNLQLAVATVETNVRVNDIGADDDHTASALVLGTEQVQQLSDDPDDFLRELQALAAGAGGPSGGALVTIDGFQNGSALPPKSSIASIRINPDLFSAQYETVPWLGARIEITTKPGAGPWHGALFFTDSASPFNATDPLSVTATPAGRQRYGFELGGPITQKKSDLFFALEKRDIDEFNVVDAVTLNADDIPAPLQKSISAPQRLWIGSARGDWQINTNDLATVSFAANVNHIGNQGAGGLALPEAGYDSLVSEYDLRLLNTETFGASLLHETRIGYTWKRTEQTPLSMSPSLQVAGYFTGGGSAGGDLNNRERDLEADDDVIFTRGRHTLKFGAQSLDVFEHDYDPEAFNGVYVFGGGSAPALDANNNPTGATTTISAIEQYRRAVLKLPGGTPTTYQLNSGNPLVPFALWRLGLYAQDDIRLNSHYSLHAGFRYQLQTSPDSFANVSPRIGFGWSPDKKSTWVIHLRAGLFSSPVAPGYALQADRLNGVRQQEATTYAPNFQDPQAPAAGSIGVTTLWQFSKTFGQLPSFASQLGIEHDFPHHWHAESDFNYGANWDQVRAENINAPIVASSIGTAPDPLAALLAPRPITPNENIFRYEKLAHMRGEFFVFFLRQYSYKSFGFSSFFVKMAGVRSDGGFRAGDTSGAANPQSSYSEQGESSRVDWQEGHLFGVNGNVKLPLKAELASQLFTSGGTPYNITTGTDANGDGDFNDRPSYASAPGPGVYSTPFGLLTTNTVNGNVPRNAGTMPAIVHLDVDLSRAFPLPGSKDHPRSLTFTARSANLLNHTNVTAVNTVLSSGSVGQPVAADTARRLELGVRFAF
ncbi:MAG TPA: TonB-dependent receptor [Acidobacteriaceae bacterium]|nr:TonB-dependent receptor [Acidobacteriaceae bacterium]